MSIADYFQKTYNLKVNEDKQPMLLVSSQGKNIQIPVEFCIVDGVPKDIKGSSQHMR